MQWRGESRDGEKHIKKKCRDSEPIFHFHFSIKSRRLRGRKKGVVQHAKMLFLLFYGPMKWRSVEQVGCSWGEGGGM